MYLWYDLYVGIFGVVFIWLVFEDVMMFLEVEENSSGNDDN